MFRTTGSKGTALYIEGRVSFKHTIQGNIFVSGKPGGDTAGIVFGSKEAKSARAVMITANVFSNFGCAIKSMTPGVDGVRLSCNVFEDNARDIDFPESVDVRRLKTD